LQNLFSLTVFISGMHFAYVYLYSKEIHCIEMYIPLSQELIRASYQAECYYFTLTIHV
jgi:hypothetical protein